METVPLTEQDIARFWSKVEKTETCWLWTACIVRKYGMFTIRIDGKRYLKKAHRIAYEILIGAIPDGKPLDHTCHVEHCVNPKHLRPVTVKENAENRTGANKGSRSGVRGVHWDSSRHCWKVVVGHNGKHHRGGRFKSIREAEAAAMALRASLFTHSDADRAA